MQFTSCRGALIVFAAALVLALSAGDAHAQAQKGGPNNPAAIRKALDEKITLDFNGASLDEALDHLSQKTKLKIVIDYFAVQQVANFGGFIPIGAFGGIAGFGGGVGGFPGGIPAPGFPGQPGAPGGGQVGVLLKIDNGKVRTALQTTLNQHNLTFVIMGDSVVITTEDIGQIRQMKQRVSVDIKGQALADALKKLSDDTGFTLLLDERQAAKAKTKINLQLEDVTLETALRLMTELAELGAVNMGNVVFVTSDTRADKLRKENATNNPNIHNFPGGLPPLGTGGRGAIGAMTAPGIAVPDRPPVAVPVPPPPPDVKK
ncbi:MAG TPA: hypothetical protein VE988_18570 [Gemmataceae bacterium]|nr:hypothetical protein [Gemmataceae bacterium]